MYSLKAFGSDACAEDLAIASEYECKLALESLGYIGNLDLNQEESRVQVADYKYKIICLPDNEEMKYMTRKLVPEQMNILRTVVASCKAIVRARKNSKVRPKPIRLIVHGGAGNDKHFKLEIT